MLRISIHLSPLPPDERNVAVPGSRPAYDMSKQGVKNTYHTSPGLEEIRQKSRGIEDTKAAFLLDDRLRPRKRDKHRPLLQHVLFRFSVRLVRAYLGRDGQVRPPCIYRERVSRLTTISDSLTPSLSPSAMTTQPVRHDPVPPSSQNHLPDYRNARGANCEISRESVGRPKAGSSM